MHLFTRFAIVVGVLSTVSLAAKAAPINFDELIKKQQEKIKAADVYRVEGSDKRVSRGEALIGAMQGKRVWKTCEEKEQQFALTKSGTPTLEKK